MSTTPLQNKPKSWTWKTWCAFASTMFFLLVGIPFGLFIAPVWDIDPVDDSMMWVTPEPIPDKENGRIDIVKAVAFLDLPESNRAQDILDNPEQYTEEIQGWIRHNQEFYDLWEIGMSKPSYQGAWPITYAEIQNFSLKHGQNCATILLFKISQLPTQEERAREYIHLLQTFNRLSKNEFTLYERFGWTGAFNRVINQFRRDFQNQAPGQTELLILKNGLQVLPHIDVKQRVRMGLNQYQIIRTETNQVESDGDISTLLYTNPNRNWWKKRQFFYQPHRTKAWNLESFLHELNRIDPVQFPGKYRSEEEITIEEHFYGDELLGLPKVFNEIGKDYCQYMGVRTFQMSERSLKSQRGFLSQLQIQAALHLYLLDHNQLPTTLADLVPAYLEEVPMDPFDGKTIKYIPEQSLIYSVGKDEFDHGGEAGEDDVINILKWTVPLGNG